MDESVLTDATIAEVAAIIGDYRTQYRLYSDTDIATKIVKRLTQTPSTVSPDVTADQLADFLQDQHYHHTNNFSELARAVCNSFSGGVLKSPPPGRGEGE